MPWKGDDIVPIKWSALKVSEAADMIEKSLNQAVEPLKQARVIAIEACKLDNLPQYVDQHISSILSELERVTGGEVTRTNYYHETKTYLKVVEQVEGSIKRAIQRLRDDIPTDAINTDKIKAKYGSTQSLI